MAGQANGAIRLLHSNSTRALLARLLPAFEERSGLRVQAVLDSGKALRERIAAGETGDAVVLGTGVLQGFGADGILQPESLRPFASTRIAAAVRQGEPMPAVDTVEALRRTLLQSRAVAHTVHGASGRYIPELFDRLGIAGAMAGRTVTRPSGYIGPVVVSGEADLALQQLPELLAVEGLRILGFIPAEVQKVLETSSGIFTSCADVAGTRALLAFLGDAAHRDVFAACGFEQAEGARAAPPVS